MVSSGIDKKDQMTKLCTKAIDIIFISSPQRTSYGILLGVALKGGSDIILQLVGKSLDIYYAFCICLGILLFHLPNLFLRHRVDENLETAMHYLIEAQKYGDFSATEKRAQWREFIRLIHEKVIADNESDKQTENESVDSAHV